jgi:hypothetical protein
LGRIGDEIFKKTVLIYGHFDVQPVFATGTLLALIIFLVFLCRHSSKMPGSSPVPPGISIQAALYMNQDDLITLISKLADPPLSLESTRSCLLRTTKKGTCSFSHALPPPTTLTSSACSFLQVALQ